MSESPIRLLHPPDDPEPASVGRLNANFVWLGRWLVNVAVLGLADLLAMAAALYGAIHLRLLLLGPMPQPDWLLALVPLWLAGAVGVKVLPGWGMGVVEELRRTTLLMLALFTFTTTLLFLTKAGELHSRLILGMTSPLSIPLMLLFRTRAKALLIRCNLYGMQAVIYGNAENGRRIIEALRAEPGLGYVPVAVIDPNTPTDTEVAGLPLARKLSGDALYAQAAILARPEDSRHEQLKTIEGPLARFRHILIIPDLQEAPSLWVQPRDLGGILGLEISCNLLDIWHRMLKATLEFVLVTLALPLVVVALPVLALLVWVYDRKNPFFVQERMGRHGKPFNVWKFRTMHDNAEALLQQALDEDEALRLEWQRHFKLRRDPRITPIGRFLRRTSLDELPQIFNVLAGQMSLVGPRPLPAYHHHQLDPQVQELRKRVRPGITGLWQVSGRSESGNEGFNRWDAYYVRNWSPWLDIIILLRTIRTVLRGAGAW